MEGTDTLASVADSDTNFVLDPSSGLYYHASSGFYYDAKEGWYYNTQDGQYYMFENGAYVPLVASTNDDDGVDHQGVGGDANQTAGDSSSGAESHHKEEPQVEDTQKSLKVMSSGSNCPELHACATTEEEGGTCQAPQEAEDLITKDSTGIGWHSQWPSQGLDHSESASEFLEDSLPGRILQNESHSEVAAGGATTNSVEEGEPGELEDTRPPSVWIEETLTELYSRNTIGTAPEREDLNVYEDSALQHLYYQSDTTAENDIQETYSYDRIDNDDGVNTLQEPHYQWQDANTWNEVEAHKQHATFENELYESDEESEELEEGEWRPEEGEMENYNFADFDEIEEGELREEQDATLEQAEVSAASIEEDPDGGQLLLEKDPNGENFQSAESFMESSEDQLDPSALRVAEEEHWQAQYLQATKSKKLSYVGSIDLWDWTKVEQVKENKKRKATRSIVRLVGRLAPNSSQVHPSLGGSGGLIRTTPVFEADHNFVKVSSGRIYKLHRPSSKQLSMSTGHVSSNLTQDWGFPIISVEAQDFDSVTTGALSRDETIEAIDAVVVSKPFVPNFGHWKYQVGSVNKRTQRSSMGTSLQTFTKEEIAEIEQRKQRYRDRAAERRTLHKGFGIGPGQKYVSERELEKQEADAATQMPAVLAKTAVARPIGRDNVGKRMLEGMGWKEGQSLGTGEGGLIDPVLAQGNTGRTGLGWS